ncbi:hypothetical protein B0H13DRAFT_2348531 [Mycena leptocephala]|nr:hypothetical protein B0H13DRAFT_2348531 [Mycena leptocephala]
MPFPTAAARRSAFMARRRLTLKSYVPFLLVAAFFLFAPPLIERYLPQAAPVAAALEWITDHAMRALGAYAFFVALFMLVGNSFEPFRNCNRYPCPGRFCAPSSCHHRRFRLCGAPAPLTPFRKLFTLLTSVLFLTYLCVKEPTISPARPVFANLAAALRGLEAMFAGIVVLLLVAWVQIKFLQPVSSEAARRGSTAAAAEPEGGETAAHVQRGPSVEVRLDDVDAVSKIESEAEYEGREKETV